MLPVSEALALYFRLQATGFTLTRDGHDLIVEPGSRLTDLDLAEIRRHKHWLLHFTDSPPETQVARAYTITPEMAALIREEWFDGREIDLDELSDDEIRALARSGRRYHVKASTLQWEGAA